MSDEDTAKAFTRIFWEIIKDDATAAEIREASYNAANLALQTQEQAISQLTEALRLTVEYVGTEMLPPLPGWSYYEALKKYAPEMAKYFENQYVKYAKEKTDDASELR